MLTRSTGQSAVETCEENVVVHQGKQCGAVEISETSTMIEMQTTSGSVSSVSATDEHASKKSDIEDSRINYGGKNIIDEEITDKFSSSSSPTGLSSPNSVSVEIPPSKNSELASDVAHGDPPAPDRNPIEKKNDVENENQYNDDADDSDLVEEDVKVCDICGDAGEEESLAVCSRCSDGAEHTYCMRDMLDKVPEGDWMCEECKSLEPATYERTEKMGRVDENEKNSCTGQANSEFVNSSDIEGHKTKGHTKISGKRLRDDADAGVSPIVKKPSLVSTAESPMTSNSSNATGISCENSLRNIARGTFSKSNSFNSLNSKSKVKPVDQIVLQRQMSSREQASLRPGRSIGKSVSFKSTSSFQSETKMKTLPHRLSQIQDAKDTTQRSSFERHSSFKMGHQSDNSTPGINKKTVTDRESPSHTTINNHCEVKPVHTDVKSAALSRTCSVAARRNADLSGSLGEFKRLSFHGDSELGILSTSGANNNEQKSDQTSPKEDSIPCSVVPERSSVKSSRDEDNIIKAAIEAALLRKPGVCRKHKTLSQSGNSSITNAAPAMPFSLKSLVIPHHEYIWKGSFEICRSGKVIDSWDGIQAHLSTCASSKVIEAVNNFKSRIVLYEVPRLRTWPIQFQDHGVRDDNIALFFFAKDLESYDKIYKFLLDNMMKNDLALRGNFNGVELLIFPSNQLHDNFQRWNMLFFLWGVFRGKKESCMQHMAESSKQFSVPQDKPPAKVSLLDSKCSVRPISNDLPAEELGSLLPSRAVNGETSTKDQPDSGLDSNYSVAVQSDGRCKELSTTFMEGGKAASSTESSGREQMPMEVDTEQSSHHHDSNNSAACSHDMEDIGDMGTCEDVVKSKMDGEDLSRNEETPFQKDRDPNNPNLELALGEPTEMKPLTEPLLVGKVDKEQHTIHEAKTKDDESASLSLSLSFPFQ